MKIIQVDSIYCRVDPAVSIAQIKKCFEYESVWWQQGAFKKEKRVGRSHYCDSPHKGWFHAGLLTKVIEYCKTQNIEIDIPANLSILPEPVKANLPEIDFREDQLQLISAVNKERRGIIQSPTGSGKTVVAGGVISQYPGMQVVFCVHTQALFQQTTEEFAKWFGSKQVGRIGQGEYDPKRITVLMVQMSRHLIEDNRFSEFLASQDILIVDEAHHIGNSTGHYSIILEECQANIRIGFTATPLKSGKERLVCEGYLGSIIGELSLNDGIEKGILVKPRLKLVPVPKVETSSRRYQDLYKTMVVLNKIRNRLIAKEAAAQIRQGKSVLIMITDVVNGHGKIIQDMMENIYGCEAELVSGSTERNIREDIKTALQLKETKCVIVTSAWREGVNIPSLDCVINAIGGKAEITVLQAIGRGLRTSEGKEELLIIDFLDPYPYLAEHTLMRLKIYDEMGILNKEAI